MSASDVPAAPPTAPSPSRPAPFAPFVPGEKLTFTSSSSIPIAMPMSVMPSSSSSSSGMSPKPRKVSPRPPSSRVASARADLMSSHSVPVQRGADLMSWRAAAKRRRCARSAAAEGAGMSRGTPTFSESVCTAARE
eukprot:630763-Prorocentrum_minimum.AAC.3